MKRFLSLLLLCAFLLSGCGFLGEKLKEPVTFYYLLDDYQYGIDGRIIGSEEREASGHRDDLSYLMALYLMGPSGEELTSPLPRGTRIFSAEVNEDTVFLVLSETEKTMTDSAFSLACACLSLTCLDLTEAARVSIQSGSRSVTMTRDSLILSDSSMLESTEESQ